MAQFTYNPITGNLDAVGMSAVVDGEVNTFDELPTDTAIAPVGSSYLVKTSTGVWLVNRRSSGLWIRTNDSGLRSTDWSYSGDFPVQSVNGQTGAVTITAALIDAAATSHSHQPSAIYCDAADVADTTLSSGEPNGIYFRNGSDNGKAIYKSSEGYAIWWDNEEEEWVLGNVPQTAKYYIGTGDTTYPWEATSWVLGPQGSGDTPVVDQAVLSNFQRDAAQDSVSTRTPKTGNASSTEVVLGSDTRLTNSRTPTAHGSTHHTNGTDAIAPNNISAAWAQVLSNQTITENTLLSAGRNRRITLFAIGVTANVDLPHENNQNGDFVTLLASSSSVASTLTIRRASVISGNSPVAYATLATLSASGQSFSFVSDGTATGWTLRAVDTHKSSHATGSADAIAPSDIGAQSLFVTTTNPISDNVTIPTTNRALIYQVATTSAVTADINLPSSGHQSGDVIVVRSGSPFTSGTTLTIKSGTGATLDTITATNQAFRYTANSTSPNGWGKVLVDTHTHAAADITSGTLLHERGGLEADVSAYNGLVKIASGSTSAVTVTSAGEALLDDADAAAQRTTLGLGNSATLNTGTTAGTVATGDHTHSQLHDRSHAITSTSDHTAGNWKVFHSNGSGEIVEFALGASGKVLQSNGASAAPTWETPSGGVSGVAASAGDVLGVSGSNITGIDAGADRLVFWDDSAGELTYLEAGSGLSISGTTLTATATGGGTKTLARFNAMDAQPVATNFATIDTRSDLAVLEFDGGSTNEETTFVGIIPEGATLSSGILVRIFWMADTATSGQVRFGIQFEKNGTDIDTASYDTATEANSAATSGTSGIETVTEITCTNIDSLAAGDRFRMKLYRDASDTTNDTMSGDCQVTAVELRQVA